MDSYAQKPKRRIKKAENMRRRQRKIKERIARLRKQDVDELSEKRKYRDQGIYLDDYDNEIDMLDETEEDSEDSLFVSNKSTDLNPDDETDSDSDSGGAILTDFTSTESETEETENKKHRRQASKNEGESESGGSKFADYLRKLYIPLRADDGIPKNPFYIVPEGQKRVTKPQSSWGGDGFATYVFAVPFKSPFSYLAIYLRPFRNLAKGWAVEFFAQTAKRIVQGDSYYMGYLKPEKKCLFLEISPMEPGVTCIVIFAVIRPESEVNEKRKLTGPFSKLN